MNKRFEVKQIVSTLEKKLYNFGFNEFTFISKEWTESTKDFSFSLMAY